MAGKATDDVVVIKAGTYEVRSTHGTATVHVGSDHTASDITQAFSRLLEEVRDAA